MKKRNWKKPMSMLLSLVMLLSLIPAAAIGAPASETVADTVIADREGVEATDIVDLKTDKADGAFANLDDYQIIGTSLESAGYSAVSRDDKTAYTDSETDYIESVAASLKDPVGAVDFEDVESGELVDIIVWLQELPNALAVAYGEEGTASITAAYANAGSLARSTLKATYRSAITYEYSEVFAGFAMTVKGSAVQKIADMPGVYAVTPDTLMYATDEAEATLDPEYDFTGMRESREIFNIAEIHDAEITGAGVIVGVLDTGIDYNHPDLKDVYKGGWNYITTSADYGRPADLVNDPMETTYAQWQASGRTETNSNGSNFYTSHGTHVSGTIAAQANNDTGNYKALGMAPDVDLYVARVLGPYGSGATTGIIAAIEDFSAGNAARGIPKADVINLSLGADQDTAYGADVYTLNNAVIAGVNVSVSAGNNAGDNMAGRSELTLGTPGTAYLPVTVAASQYGGEALRSYDNVSASKDGESSDTTFGLLIEGQDVNNAFSDNTISGTPAPTYVEGKGYEAYLAFGANDTNPTLAQLQAIPDGSLEGKILVVKRGLDFTAFLAQAKRAGAGALIIVNSATYGENYITNMTIGGTNADHVPVFSTYASTSAKLTALADGGTSVYLQLGSLTSTQQALTPAYFSSIGPVTETVGLKPDIIAPGWSIVSTQPAFITTADHNTTDYSAAYGLMSGTSMSAPHIAGILALMKQAYPDATPAEIKARLMNTADNDLITALTDGTPASVLEVGAGFVDPYRAIMEEDGKDIFVTVADDIPGQTSGSVISNQTLSSLSFGLADSGGFSRELPVTVHGADSFEISVIYNDGTRYSNNAVENGVTLETDTPVNGTFNAWVEVPEDAEEGYYEGYLIVTVDGSEYSLPWLVRVGEAASSGDFDPLFISERPIISTSTNTGIRSANGTAPLNSNSTTLYFTWEGTWPNDPTYGTADLDLYLINADTLTVDYYYGYTTLSNPINDGTSLWRWPNIIANTAYSSTSGSSKVTIANGAYYLGILAGGEIYYFYEVGLVFSNGVGENERPQLTLETPVMVDSDSSVTTAAVSGRIYSPAIAKAGDHGFYWTEVDDFFYYGLMYYIDQTWNVLGYSTTGSVYISGSTPYNLYMHNGDPWICDVDGYFNLNMPVTQANKDGGYVFTSGTNHAVVGVEAFYYNDNGTSWPLIGANKSTAVTPVYNLAPKLNSVTAANGEINAAISNLPTARALSDFSAEYSVNGGDFEPLALTGMTVSGTNANATVKFDFEQFETTTYDQSITIRLTYRDVTLTAEAFNIPKWAEADELLDDVVFSNTGSVSLGVNEKVTLTIDSEPAIDWSVYTVTWSTADKKIATVNSSGVVAGKSAGYTTIEAVISDPYGNSVTLVYYVMVY